jgi:sortase A
MISPVRKEPFGYWTRTDSPTVERTRKRADGRAGKETVYYRSRSKRRVSRAGIALLGAALILLSLGIVVADVLSVGPSSPVAITKEERDKSMRLTVPQMKRVRNVPVFTASTDDKAKLDTGVVHVKETGFPWEEEANVYIAGHRLGYPRTGSFLVFWDLNKLKDGDRVVLRDSEGRKYVYRVYDKFVVEPGATAVTKPVDGKNIVSLQTCTLPNYKHRLIVRAELVSGGGPSIL